MVLGKPPELLVEPGARLVGFRALEILQQLAVASGDVFVVRVPRVMEQPEHFRRRHVLDLLNANQRRLPTVPLDLLGEPLKILVPLRRVGQEIRRALQRHRAERAQTAPDPHAQARRPRRHPDQEKKEMLLGHGLQ